MTEIRVGLAPVGDDLGTVGAAIGAESDSVAVPSNRLPPVITDLPRISDGFDTDTLTLDETGLTGITAREWRIVGGAVQGTGATLSGAGLGGQYIECEVTCDQGVLTSWPIMVYSSTHMGEPMDASNIVDDEAIVALVPHALVTHVAIADGPWTDAATWRGGRVPRNGARVLIPDGIAVTYDQHRAYRYHWIRIDGSLTWSLTNPHT